MKALIHPNPVVPKDKHPITTGTDALLPLTCANILRLAAEFAPWGPLGCYPQSYAQ